MYVCPPLTYLPKYGKDLLKLYGATKTSQKQENTSQTKKPAALNHSDVKLQEAVACGKRKFFPNLLGKTETAKGLTMRNLATSFKYAFSVGHSA